MTARPDFLAGIEALDPAGLRQRLAAVRANAALHAAGMSDPSPVEDAVAHADTLIRDAVRSAIEAIDAAVVASVNRSENAPAPSTPAAAPRSPPPFPARPSTGSAPVAEPPAPAAVSRP